MEVDPFQNSAPPPRHQVESSDESDEDVYPSSQNAKTVTAKTDPRVVVVWKGPQEKRRPLLVVWGDAGRQWAMGVKLDDVNGSVLVDDVEVAHAFIPSWAELTIVCAHTRLPNYASYAFASTLISAIRPTNVVILDTYSVPAYISYSPPALDPPIRYLRTTATSKDPPPPDVEPFSPPNLIQSTAASFLSILEGSSHRTPATLLLLPSAHSPPSVPPDLQGRSGPELQEKWTQSSLARIHKVTGTILGFDSPWSEQCLPKRPGLVHASRRGDIGEGSMYM